MRWLLLWLAALGCGPAPQASEPVYYPPPTYGAQPMAAPAAYDLTQAGTVVDHMIDFAFDGGLIEFEMRRDGNRVIEVARSRYMVPVVMHWQISDLDNLLPNDGVSGVVILPAAAKPNSLANAVVLMTYDLADPHAAYHRQLTTHARFGDPNARPTPYA